MSELDKMIEEVDRSLIEQKCDDYEQIIEEYYSEVSQKLGFSPDIQGACIENLYNARFNLNKARAFLRSNLDPVKDESFTEKYSEAMTGIIDARYYISKVNIELAKTRSREISYKVVAVVTTIVILIIFGGYLLNWFQIGESAEILNTRTILGIPVTVIFWSIVGSLTGMLVDAGNVYFNDNLNGAQWIMYRSITGIVMGVIIYLLLISGLIIFTGSGADSIKVPEIIWIISFLGGFSQKLSPNLLKKIENRIESSETTTTSTTITPSKEKIQE